MTDAILYFDSETTGVPVKGAAPGSPLHPHICQLAAQLVSNGRVVAEFNLLVKPHNWGVPKEAEAVHGISTEMCERFGMPIKSVITLLIRLAQRAGVSVAHQREFDNLLVWTELIRCELATELAFWLEMPGYCTMEASTPIMKLPPTARMVAAGRNHFKNPNLQEAHTFFTGAGFDGGHDAMADVSACRRVHEGILKHQAANPVAVCLDE